MLDNDKFEKGFHIFLAGGVLYISTTIRNKNGKKDMLISKNLFCLILNNSLPI